MTHKEQRVKKNRASLLLGFAFAAGAVSGATYTYSWIESHNLFTSLERPLLSPSIQYMREKFPNVPLDFRLTEVEQILTERIQSEVKNKTIEEASIYYRGLENGPWFGIGENNRFLPGSLLKLPLAIAIIKLAESDPSILSRTLQYSDSSISHYYDEQYIKPSSPLQLGSSYTVKTLIEKSLMYSDNVATILLERAFGRKAFERVVEDLHVPMDKTFSKIRGLTAKEYSAFFRILYNSSYLTPENSEFILETMSKSAFTEGLRSVTKSDIIVAHKFGESLSQDGHHYFLSDCGIVYKIGQPYILCVMFKSDSRQKLERDLYVRIFRDIPILF